jgi:hypothetical protein
MSFGKNISFMHKISMKAILCEKDCRESFWQMRGKVRAFYRHFETPMARMV